MVNLLLQGEIIGKQQIYIEDIDTISKRDTGHLRSNVQMKHVLLKGNLIREQQNTSMTQKIISWDSVRIDPLHPLLVAKEDQLLGSPLDKKKTPRSSVIAGQTGYYNSLLKDRSCRAQTKVCSTMVPFMKYPFAEQRTCRQAIN